MSTCEAASPAPRPPPLSMDVISDLTTGICEVPDKLICPDRELPVVEASAAMGRQEADYVWKKDTENIQEVFDIMEELGSDRQVFRRCGVINERLENIGK
ncbi:hypothetical protein INR49_031715 [Caranx melampygus]|nr:hypothetical protein INR49_031715 [Caranx melampygus]